MIPDKDKQHHDTPKRFDLGYYTRETFDLFGCGWRAANRNLKEQHRLEEARQTRKAVQELLEEALYDKTSRGTVDDQLKALNYFEKKRQFEMRDIPQQPYSWGEQVLSIASALSIIAITVGASVTIANWACGSNQSNFCRNIRVNTGIVTQQFTEPKN